jgi:hypothetical protein
MCYYVGLEDVDSGIVSDNFVTYTLSIKDAIGTWQIAGNRSEDILLWPKKINLSWFGAKTVSFFWDIYTGNYSGSAVEWLQTAIDDEIDRAVTSASGHGTSLGELIGRFGNTIFGTLLGTSGQSKKALAPSARGEAGVPVDTDAAVNTDNTAPRTHSGENARTVEEMFMKEVASGIQDIFSGLASATPIYAPQVEVPYQAQVIGNWVRRLVIGYSPQSGTAADNTGAESSVTHIQLNDNRAEFYIATNEYKHIIKSDNFANTFIPDVPASTLPTVYHNPKLV